MSTQQTSKQSYEENLASGKIETQLKQLKKLYIKTAYADYELAKIMNLPNSTISARRNGLSRICKINNLGTKVSSISNKKVIVWGF